MDAPNLPAWTMPLEPAERCVRDRAKDVLETWNRTVFRLYWSDNLNVAAAPIFCTEMRRLLEEFVTAVSEFLRLESARQEAKVAGENPPFDAVFEGARKRKEWTKEAIKAHQKEHGC